jgi:hypothetical protein
VDIARCARITEARKLGSSIRATSSTICANARKERCVRGIEMAPPAGAMEASGSVIPQVRVDKAIVHP